jgi:hypothetical protein
VEPRRFAILMPWGRVGSNLVMNIVAQSGPAKLANETFNTIKGEAEQLAWYREHYEFGAEAPSKPVIGCKQNVLSITDPAGFAERLLADGVRVVRMRRDNLVKVAVSQMRAEVYAERTKEQTGKPRWAVRKGEQPLEPIVIDPEILQRRLSIASKAQDRLMGMFSPGDVLDIEYADIRTDLDGLVGRLRRWIGLPTDQPFKVAFEKATSDNLKDAVLNFRQVKRRLKGTPYESQVIV